MIEVKDIEGRIIKIGDEVYYSRNEMYGNKSILTIHTVTNITDKGKVRMDNYLSSEPSRQIAVIKSLREKKFERIISD